MFKRRPKTRIRQWRGYYQFRRVQRVISSAMLAGAALGIGGLLIQTIGSEDSAALALALNPYANLVVALIAVVTAVATVAYVRLTYSILQETIEARRSEVRPFLRLSLGEPQVRVDNERERPLMFFDVPVKVTNHGRGRAVGVRVHITVPYTVTKQGNATDYIGTDVAWPREAVIEAGADFEGQASLFMPAFDLPEQIQEFLELEARFEDATQGLYCLRQFHDLFDFGASERKLLLTLRYEALYHFPYTRRNSVQDTDMSLSLAWGEVPVYERRIPD